MINYTSTKDFADDVDLSSNERQIRKQQANCKHTSWSCPQCHLHKDNIRYRDSVIDECIAIFNLNKDESFDVTVDKLIKLQRKGCYNL